MVASGTSIGTWGERYQFGPSLAPLPKRPYDLTEEENEAEVQAQVRAHFGPKPPPLPKEKVPEHVIDHFIRMAEPPAPKPIDSDYERQIRKAYQAQKKKESSSSSSQAAAKKSGKTVPQLGEQAVQSIPPLIVPTHVSTGADQLVITDDHRRMAEETGVTVEQLLEIEPMETFKEEQLKRKYARGEPLVKPEEIKHLSTRMYELHQCYMREVKTTDRESLMVRVKAEHYFHEKALWVEFQELFQLFNEDALDKSIVSCYCL